MLVLRQFWAVDCVSSGKNKFFDDNDDDDNKDNDNNDNNYNYQASADDIYAYMASLQDLVFV